MTKIQENLMSILDYNQKPVELTKYEQTKASLEERIKDGAQNVSVREVVDEMKTISPESLDEVAHLLSAAEQKYYGVGAAA